jgi:hypothetical protein
MKIVRTNNLEVNFVSKERVDAESYLDDSKLWLMQADVAIETWIGDSGLFYRRYSSGWIEQGGNNLSFASGSAASMTITLVVQMTNVNYNALLTITGSPSYGTSLHITEKTVSTMTISKSSYSSSSAACTGTWYVCGKGAQS